MSRICLLALCGLSLFAFGCFDVKVAPKPAPVPTATSDESPAKSVETAEQTAVTTTDAGDAKDKTEADAAVPKELKLEGVSVFVPQNWKQATPANKIIEAEFALPKAEGDQFDGRLTIMAAGGDTDANIDRWKSEFLGQTEIKTETLEVGTLEVTWVDIRGEWRGSASSQVKSGPRPDYRMLAVIIPFSEMSSYFYKLTGPRETLAAHEEAFKSFVKSTRVKR